ncbi:transcriptional regulator MtlR [Halobacillus andaensis]|uniref:Transcriptional regulator MtlR n=1 Tax=Halobacillus andaensis TaxID=1176239 RepID=A0A917EY62_HALAA|nr:PRD domain-containing protein [Halobacillus andaensis]MBP2006125.1 mannitol operon transcriptional antiterminator [Halobacillus andaensis]GGF23457.1 transcriptional regulator MtlR [Halobacillus andaensis]
MYMTARERKILQLLLNAQSEITVKAIADELDVSSRTVHRDLKGVEDLLSSYKLRLEKKSGSGLVLHGEVKQKDLLRMEINQLSTLDYTPEERHVMVLSRLLEAREPIKLLSLANELGVTVATISNDLDKIEDDLYGFHLTLIRKRGYGVEIQGEEAKIREAIGFLIMRHMDELDLLNILRENIGNSSTSTVDTVSDQLLGLVDKEKLSVIERSVEGIRSSLAYDLADSAYLGLVIHLALAIERIQKGEMIEMAEEYLEELRQTQEFEMASQLIRKLEETFELNLPEAETGYITMHLMGAKARYNQDSFLEATSLSVAFKAKQLIEFVSKEVGVNLHDSPYLLNDLVVHLKPSVYRLQQKMDIQNPLKKQIEEDYEELFQIVENAVRHVFPEFHFPKEETAFLVMHFASALLNDEEVKGLRALVVCSSGIGTAKILAAKLSQQFKEIEEVEHESLFELKNIDPSAFDLVVSTVGLVDFKDYIHVNPMLPSADVHKIEHAIRRKKVTKQTKQVKKEAVQQDETMKSIQNSVLSVQRYATAVHQLLGSLSVYQVKGEEAAEILQTACHVLEEADVIESADAVLQALTDREKVGGLGIPDTKLALYHARAKEVKQPSFTVHVIDEPISIKGMDGTEVDASTILLMLAPQEINKESLEVLSFLSSLIVDDPKGIETLQSQEEDKIMHYLSNQLHQFFKKELL